MAPGEPGRASRDKPAARPPARQPTAPGPSGPATAKQYDVLFRLLLIGDSGVDKTCLPRGFTDEFHSSHISTIGVDFKMKTIEHIMKWVSDVDENAPEGVQKILIGNKTDEEQKRQVGREQGQQLAEQYGMDFYEASACTSLNIKESFMRLTELVLQAHRKELEGLRTRANDELALAELEEDEGKPEGLENSLKTCWW
eukprot:bmy_03517T0